MTPNKEAPEPKLDATCARALPLNTGVCLGRVLFSFLVICNHYFSHGLGDAWIIPLRETAVPFFFILAFYFLRRADNNDKHSIRKRLRRILVPFWFWGIAFAIPYFIGVAIRGWSFQAVFLALERIVLQLSLGHVYDAPLWFLFSLAVLTGFWMSVRKTKIVRQREPLFLSVIFAASLFLQYSGVNKNLFGTLNWFIRYPLGRLAECIPFAIAGIAMARSKLVDKLSTSRLRLFHLVWISILCYPIPVLAKTPPGFGYQGLHLIRAGFFLVVFFLTIPLEWIPERSMRCIQVLSRYSLGVYCIHVPVGMVFLYVLNAADIGIDPFFRCLLIHVISWCLCWMLAKSIPRLQEVVQ